MNSDDEEPDPNKRRRLVVDVNKAAENCTLRWRSGSGGKGARSVPTPASEGIRAGGHPPHHPHPSDRMASPCHRTCLTRRSAKRKGHRDEGVMGAGFDAYQGKPIKVKDFVATVERLLERRRS